jgi:deazaflavin-dependent oxidoreductase (nitroreductase family)
MANAKDLLLKGVNVVHRGLFNLTGGRVSGSLLKMPVVKLTTTGRKSGEPRTVMLTVPVVDGDKYVLVASYGGDDRHPAWFLNLRDQPKVEVTVHGETRPMHARIASAEEKAELWPRVVASYKGYAGYQQKTERDIPLVILEPVA